VPSFILKSALIAVVCFLLGIDRLAACSIVFYVDDKTGKSFIRIQGASPGNLVRLWYGWEDFAQGGVNEAGLFFDGAATPERNDSSFTSSTIRK